jgi:phosphatidylglycerol:prolipoprotein diacylglycerol transferase
VYPILFSLSFAGREFTCYTYGFLLGWAFSLAALTGAHFGELDGFSRKKLFQFSVCVIICGALGSHLHWVVTQAPAVRDFSDILIPREGFTFYGAISAGALAGLPVARLLQIPYWFVSDAAGMGISVAHGVGRLGCFFFGCDYGVLATGKLAWLGVSFPKNSPAWRDQLAARLIGPDAERSLAVVPTQLLEVAVELGLATSLWFYLTRRPRPRAGTAFLIYWLVYGLLRALLEQLRGDPDRGTLLGLSTSTAIGLGTAAAAILLLTAPPLVRLRPERASPAKGRPRPRDGVPSRRRVA